jgi:hypothetical protein
LVLSVSFVIYFHSPSDNPFVPNISVTDVNLATKFSAFADRAGRGAAVRKL